MINHPITTPKLSTKFTFAVFLSGLILFTINTLQTFGFGVEESRYILFAQEMLRSGLTPYPILYGQPYPDYPATHTILIYLSSLFSNKVSPFTAILPSALASALTLALTYRIAALHSSRWGIYATLFLLATYEFLLLARTPSPDPLIAAVTITCFYLVYTKTNNKIPWLLSLLFVGGFLIRGPIGLVIPALVVGSFYLLGKKYKWFFMIACTSTLLLVVCIILQLAVAQKIGGITFAKEVFFMEVGGRISHLGQRVFYYYFINSFGGFAISFPIAVITLFCFRKELIKPQTKEAQLLRYIAGWAFIILLTLSFPSEKHFRYIIAAAPAFALIAGYGFAAKDSNYLLTKIYTWILTLCKIFPLLGLTIIGFSSLVSGKTLQIKYLTTELLLSALFFTSIFIRLKILNREKQDSLFFGVGVATLLTLFIMVGQPLAEQYITSIKPLADKIATIRKPDERVVFYQIEPDREGLKFSVLLNNNIPQIFLTTPQQLAQFNQPAIFIAFQQTIDAMNKASKVNFKILWQEKLARNNWVAFRKTTD